jgi:predicted RNA methylase
VPNKWKNRNWNELKYEIRDGENKLWTNQLLSYMRNRKSFHLMLDIIRKNNINMTNVVDATANIGGDAIGFAMEPEVQHVKAYEIKHSVYDMLVKNIELYGLSDKIEAVCGPFDYDVPIGSLVIIDPPFEKANSAKSHYNLSIDMMPIYAVVQKILEKANSVIITMPREYKYNKKYADDHNQQVKVYETSKNVKIFLICKK